MLQVQQLQRCVQSQHTRRGLVTVQSVRKTYCGRGGEYTRLPRIVFHSKIKVFNCSLRMTPSKMFCIQELSNMHADFTKCAGLKILQHLHGGIVKIVPTDIQLPQHTGCLVRAKNFADARTQLHRTQFATHKLEAPQRLQRILLESFKDGKTAGSAQHVVT